MNAVVACVVTQHNLWLVVAAAAICVLSWAGALLALDRIATAPARFRRAWRFLAALSAGGGTWATHFVAMLAFDPGLPIGFDLDLTLLSLGVGVIGAWLAFEAFDARRDMIGRISGGAALGLTVVALHYVGMAGVQVGAHFEWSSALLIASVLFSVGFAIAGMHANSVARTLRGKAVACGLFVTGVVLLHFTGMGAVTLTPDPRLPSATEGLDPAGLAMTVSLAALLLLATAAGFAVADRRITETKLAATKRMQRLAEASFEGLILHDGAVVLESNPQFAAMCGREMRDVVGQPLTSFTKAGAHPTVTEEERNSGAYMFETVLKNPNGDVPVEVHTRFYSRSEGVFVSAIRDISLRRRAEAAEQESIAKSQYLANMSHELRTPLNGIIGYSEIIMEDSSDAAARADAAHIRSSARHLLSLINDILDLSRTEAGQVELAIEACDLPALAEEAFATVRPAALKAGLAMEIDIGRDVGAIFTDGFRLKQCMLNLMSNAVKFTERGVVRLRLRAFDEGRRVAIEVADTGIGMTQEQAARVFQAFVQADATISRRYGGTGLGLAITERLVKLLGGEITLATAPGEGSVFTISLPVDAFASQSPQRMVA